MPNLQRVGRFEGSQFVDTRDLAPQRGYYLEGTVSVNEQTIILDSRAGEGPGSLRLSITRLEYLTARWRRCSGRIKNDHPSKGLDPEGRFRYQRGESVSRVAGDIWILKRRIKQPWILKGKRKRHFDLREAEDVSDVGSDISDGNACSATGGLDDGMFGGREMSAQTRHHLYL
ncbi:hypothetical protein CIRG_09477 [Coccidioides immitis RMSCC 2394]|uniref:Uncharacterized protein n=1 Tax=Coccidioides immitis RMSCC 2394 TaxID=404692 RepID=A0A0J7BGC8_COCIT|nr:hypothetical protein CIRG_09477 [Coccidioides immitis RMSCC 2394]